MAETDTDKARGIGGIKTPNPRRDRIAALTILLREHFPTAVRGQARVGMFVVSARQGMGPEWIELHAVVDDRHPPILIEQFRSVNFTEGCYRAKEEIERRCRETLTMLLQHPDHASDKGVSR